MKCPALLLAALLVMAPGATQAAQPTDAQLDDWMVYIKSIGVPATIQICGPLLGKKAQFESAGMRWLSAKRARIAAGQALAESNPPKGMTLAQYNAAMLEDFRTKFVKQPESYQRDWCTKYLASIEAEASKP